jgi:hypothetical protein
MTHCSLLTAALKSGGDAPRAACPHGWGLFILFNFLYIELVPKIIDCALTCMVLGQA